jgi:hypothetical protein
LTESPRAKWILDNWETMLPKFIKVFPHEYKRVLGVKRTPVALMPDPREPSADTLAGIATSELKNTREVLRG